MFIANKKGIKRYLFLGKNIPLELYITASYVYVNSKRQWGVHSKVTHSVTQHLEIRIKIACTSHFISFNEIYLSLKWYFLSEQSICLSNLVSYFLYVKKELFAISLHHQSIYMGLNGACVLYN